MEKLNPSSLFKGTHVHTCTHFLTKNETHPSSFRATGIPSWCVCPNLLSSCIVMYIFITYTRTRLVKCSLGRQLCKKKKSSEWIWIHCHAVFLWILMPTKTLFALGTTTQNQTNKKAATCFLPEPANFKNQRQTMTSHPGAGLERLRCDSWSGTSYWATTAPCQRKRQVPAAAREGGKVVHFGLPLLATHQSSHRNGHGLTFKTLPPSSSPHCSNYVSIMKPTKSFFALQQRYFN